VTGLNEQVTKPMQQMNTTIIYPKVHFLNV